MLEPADTGTEKSPTIYEAAQAAPGAPGETPIFSGGERVTGWRVDAAPTVGLDFSGAGYYLRPSAGYRYTQYSLDDTAAATALRSSSVSHTALW